MIRRDQCRAARGFLHWSQRDLANAANVSLSTIRDFEIGKHEPIQNNLFAIRTAFENAGLAFTNGDSPGVRRLHGTDDNNPTPDSAQ